eukprot:CAMPEP_0114998808 /NCGR_PEP_ID=MMETSP0216-20121206/15749_1 /TAXON_ID=223996 /ORGANISM="Protocruzia adherens, Strain Boccale" /LENGTH=96 /DNA_ID=CAMNT_0002363519 /DNA_START=472 /DNA_END=762 /DNA_ORIENTATION=+
MAEPAVMLPVVIVPPKSIENRAIWRIWTEVDPARSILVVNATAKGRPAPFVRVCAAMAREALEDVELIFAYRPTETLFAANGSKKSPQPKFVLSIP